MRVLIATATAGAGHLQAANALEEALRAAPDGLVVEKVDVLDYTSALFRKAYAQGYVKVVAAAPELYALAFKKSDDPVLLKKLSRWRRRLSALSAGRFMDHVEAFRPDVVLCTHFMPPELVGRLKSKGGFSGRLVNVVTDFEAHALWMEPAVDLYCVAAEETKARLVARGVPKGAVAVTGIPISKRFSQAPTGRQARQALGLLEGRPTLLLLGGGFGMGPVAGMLAQLDKLERPVQTLVVAGRNEALRVRLAAGTYRHPTKILGFCSNMHELMAASDLILTKPGGLTVSEALAVGRPLLIVDPIPGQEAANSDFLLERGAAAKLNRLEDLPSRLEALLAPAALKRLSRGAKRLGRPEAADDVCRLALKR